MGERKGREGLGDGRTGSRPPGRVLYRRKGSPEGRGHCLQEALWSHAAYEKYLHAFATLGPSAQRCRVGTGGTLGQWPSGGDPQGPVSASLKSVQFVGFYLQAGGPGGKSKVV